MTERRADDATREVQSWLKCEYLQDHVGDTFDGVISAVTSFGLFVELSGLYIEGLVHISALPGDYYQFDAAKQRLVGERSGRSFKLGGAVRVQVARVDLDDKKIDLEMIDTKAPKGGDKKPASKRRRRSSGGGGKGSAGGDKRNTGGGKNNAGGGKNKADGGKSDGSKNKAGGGKRKAAADGGDTGKRKTGLRRHH